MTVNAQWMKNSALPITTELPFYAISAILTVSGEPVAAIPEPATLTLFAAGLAGLGFVMWRRRRVR